MGMNDAKKAGEPMMNVGQPTPENFQLKAKEVICKAYNGNAHSVKDERMYVEDLYVVWFCKTLQNWKCLISTDKIFNQYFEVTYDGDSHCTYLDTYTKAANLKIED